MYKELADQLWDLTQATFKKSMPDMLLSTFGAQQDRNEAKHKMMRAIAQLKATDSPAEAQELANAIWADAMVANAQGWMTDETAGRVQDLIAQIMPVEQ